jgi:hypothetical protein
MVLLQPPIGERRRSAGEAQEQRLQMRTRQPRRRQVPTQPKCCRNIGKIKQFVSKGREEPTQRKFHWYNSHIPTCRGASGTWRRPGGTLETHGGR